MSTTIKNIIDSTVQGWRKNGGGLVSSHKQCRDALLNNSAVKAALANYINRLNLQGQVNSGKMSEDQALKAFQTAGKNFMRELNTHVDAVLTRLQNKPELIQTDLSNPINMQNQLNLPGSLANLAMNDFAESIANDMNVQASMLESDNQQTAQIQQQTSEQQTESVSGDVGEHIVHDLEKGALICGALKAIDDLDSVVGKKAVEDAFHDVTGIKGGSFEGIEDEAAASESKSFMKTLKPDNIKKMVDSEE